MSTPNTFAPSFCTRCQRGDHGNHGHGGNGGCLSFDCDCGATGGRSAVSTTAPKELFLEPEDAFSRAFELNADEIHRAYASSQIAEGW